MTSSFNQFSRGVRAELPILLGVMPFGMIYGVLAMDAGLTSVQSQAMSAIVFAGSAQIITTQLINLGVPGFIMVLTIAVVNLRHMLYSASLAPYLQNLRTVWKLLLSYLLTDEAYAVTVIYYQNTDRNLFSPIYEADKNTHLSISQECISTEAITPTPKDLRHWFFLGAGLALWLSWQVSTAIGIYLGAIVPESWSLDFTLALTFIALVVPNLKDRASQASALSAGIVALIVFSTPYKLGLLIAAIAGILCGILVENKS